MTGRRLGVGIMGLGLFVAVVGGVITWQHFDAWSDARDRQAAVRVGLGDVDGMLRARLAEAMGQAGLDDGYPTDDAALEERLDRIADLSGADLDGYRDGLETREDELVADAAEDGSPDEGLLVGLASELRQLEDAVLEPVATEVRIARDRARLTVVVLTLATAGLWVAAATTFLPGHRSASG